MKRTYTPEQKESKRLYDIEYLKKNKEKKKEQYKKWCELNKEKKKQTDKEYASKNKEAKRLYDKQYRENNKTKKKKTDKNYYETNKNIISEKGKIYRNLNKNKINLAINKRKANDPLFKLKCDMRSLILQVFNTKGVKKESKTEQILGCSFEFFKTYLESKFEPWMNWTNKGNWNGKPIEINVAWDVDHIESMSNAKTVEDVIRLNHYTNLQPLCSYTNRYIKRG